MWKTICEEIFTGVFSPKDTKRYVRQTFQRELMAEKFNRSKPDLLEEPLTERLIQKS